MGLSGLLLESDNKDLYSVMFQIMWKSGRNFIPKGCKETEGQRKLGNRKVHNYHSPAILLQWSKKFVQDEINM